MKTFTVTFSPTETSKRVSEWISDVFSTEKTRIDLCSKEVQDIMLTAEDICIFSMPCYGGRIPQIATERLNHIHGSNTNAIVCITYGNRAFDDALLELTELVTDHGFHVLSACAIVSEHNIMKIFAKGRPTLEDKQKITEFALATLDKLKHNNRSVPIIPGQHPYKEIAVKHPDIFVDHSHCIACGLCAAECPVQAISEGDWETDQVNCIGCMRCIKCCPTNCRSLDEKALNAMIEHLRPSCESRKDNLFIL